MVIYFCFQIQNQAQKIYIIKLRVPPGCILNEGTVPPGCILNGGTVLILIPLNQYIFSAFLIKLTNLGGLLCLNGPDINFPGQAVMTIRNYSIVLDDSSQRQMFLTRRIKILSNSTPTCKPNSTLVGLIRS